jgi:hypothetical protein
MMYHTNLMKLLDLKSCEYYMEWWKWETKIIATMNNFSRKKNEPGSSAL